MGNPEKLRTGFTTGTCAAAASAAAVLAIVRQESITETDVRLPNGSTARIPIESCRYNKESATCTVIKDGGDDPDVTHGARIVSDVKLGGAPGDIMIEGGRGVGTVTKPGLGLEIGRPAINPVPTRMITESAKKSAGALLEKTGIQITISVPEGEALGPKTDNPRLGILGGISILGTSGIVVPFSTAAFAASIRQNIDVAVAMGEDTIVLTTGGRSESFAAKIIDLPNHCFVQMGDFAGYAMQECAKKSVREAQIVGFIGKFAKIAAGTKQTHVKGSKVDTGFLARLGAEAGATVSIADEMRNANTARHALEIATEHGITGFADAVCQRVQGQMSAHAGGRVAVGAILFDFEGGVIARRDATR